MMDYLKTKRAKSPAPTTEAEPPLLNEEDEAFLHRIATEGVPPELPQRPRPPLPQRPQDLAEAGDPTTNDAQLAVLENPRDASIPRQSDAADSSFASATQQITSAPEKAKNARRSRWSWLRRDSRDSKRKATATGLASAADSLKSPNAQPNEDGNVSDPEALKEEEEMTSVLEQLNLAAVNNRVFSVSKESQELLHKFTLVLKDLVNGVPTAYGDLESLLTNSENQLQRTYAHLPPWLQKLVEQLPSKMTKSIGPEMLAVAAEKQGLDSKYANLAASSAEKAGLKVRIPSLKDLVTKPGAVAGMLKAIMNFLKLRFPAFLGMNVLYSLALFVLLFALWYCHKRGREVRLEKDRSTEFEASGFDDAAIDTSSRAPPAMASSHLLDSEQVMGIRRVEEGANAERDTSGYLGYAEGGSLAQYERKLENQR